MNASSRPQAARSLAGFGSVRRLATWRKGAMRLVCSSGGSERRMVSIRRSLASAGVKRTNTPALGARVEGGGTLGIDDHGIDVEVGQARVEGAPALPAVGALEDAAALGARVEDGGGLRVDGQGGHREIGQPRTDCAPALPAIGALEDPIGARSHVEGGGGLGVDRQGADECVRGGREIGDGAPALPAVGALEDAANEEATKVAATGRIEGGGSLGDNGKADGKTNISPKIAQFCGVTIRAVVDLVQLTT